MIVNLAESPRGLAAGWHRDAVLAQLTVADREHRATRNAAERAGVPFTEAHALAVELGCSEATALSVLIDRRRRTVAS